MARPGVTREMIFEAADAIAREGRTPTVLMIRERLGGGSPNTISPHLAAWKEQNQAKPADSLPPLPDPVQSAMRQVWGAAWQDAQAQLEAEREALNTIRKELERERAEMMAEIERLDGELETTRERLRNAAAAVKSEQEAHAQTKGELLKANAVIEEQKKQIASEEKHAQELRNVAKLAGDKNTKLEKENSALKIEVATLTERTAHIGDLKKQVEVLQGKLAELAKPVRQRKKM